MAKRFDENGRLILPEKMTRRTILDWLGKSAVLGLSSPLLVACTKDGALADDDTACMDPFDRDAGSDGGTGDGGPGNQLGGACEPGDFPFAEGEENHEVYQGWGERTVDPQEITDILESWTLTVDGMVNCSYTIDFADLLALPRQDQVTDFHCVEGWSILDVPWNGVHLSQLFERARVWDRATHVTFHTLGDKYNESLPLDVALEPRTLLAYGIGCGTLPLAHGFPVRTVVPRKWGYKSPKYVYRIELTDQPVAGFWVKAGYPYAGDVPEDKLRPGKY